jgi:hypothetical protein
LLLCIFHMLILRLERTQPWRGLCKLRLIRCILLMRLLEEAAPHPSLIEPWRWLK